MCLISESVYAQCAEKDIVCYKIVDPDILHKRFFSYHTGFIYRLGGKYFEPKFSKEDFFRRIYFGFHSYHTLEEAQRHVHKGAVILKCVIPEGSWYYTQKSPCKKKTVQYCSSQIKVVAWKTPWRGKWKENFEK